MGRGQGPMATTLTSNRIQIQILIHIDPVWDPDLDLYWSTTYALHVVMWHMLRRCRWVPLGIQSGIDTLLDLDPDPDHAVSCRYMLRRCWWTNPA